MEISNKFLPTSYGEFIRMDLVVAIRWNDIDNCYRATMVSGHTVKLTKGEVELVIAVGGYMGQPINK